MSRSPPGAAPRACGSEEVRDAFSASLKSCQAVVRASSSPPGGLAPRWPSGASAGAGPGRGRGGRQGVDQEVPGLPRRPQAQDQGRQVHAGGDGRVSAAPRTARWNACLPRAGMRDSKHPDEALGAVQPQVCRSATKTSSRKWPAASTASAPPARRPSRTAPACHDSLHKVHKSGDPDSPLSPVNQIKTCGACHEDMMGNYETANTPARC
jgi:hypothetical protein